MNNSQTKTRCGLQLCQLLVKPGGCLKGTLTVPGDKSISHRAIMLGAITEGVTRIHNCLEGEDVLATLEAFRRMGIDIKRLGPGELIIHGKGLRGLQAADGPLDLGNSGTSMRLLAGLLAGQAFDSELTGDASLRGRPMARVAEPLREMGAAIETVAAGRPPLRIQGGRPLHGINYRLPVPSAQVKSCLLLAGLYADGATGIIEPAPTRDHTERLLGVFGYPVQRHGSTIRLEGGGRLVGTEIHVPGDISSAAFFMVGACIAADSELVLERVGINETRIGIINILSLMGAEIGLQNVQEISGEPVADIHVRAARLRGIDIPMNQVPLAIDEFPAILMAAACAQGRTVLRGASELRIKESDRIQVMAEGLQALGIYAEPTPDGMVIEGSGGPLMGGHVNSHGDHRVAMAFAMAGLVAEDEVVIEDCENIATSFPGFVEVARQAGLRIEGKNER